MSAERPQVNRISVGRLSTTGLVGRYDRAGSEQPANVHRVGAWLAQSLVAFK